MLLTVTTTHRPATDLGYLLHKSPFRVHSLEQVFGKAHIFYPESTAERCTAALLLEIDSIGWCATDVAQAVKPTPWRNTLTTGLTWRRLS